MVPLFGALQHDELVRCRTPGFGQAAKSSIAAFRAFNYPGGDMPSRLVLLASERENVASPLQSHFHVCQRSLVKPFGNRHGCLTSEAGFLCAHGGTMLHVFVGLPRFAKNNPCKSAAFLRMPARFIASVRSTPGFMLRACSSAITASTSRLTLGGGTFFS
jgi:hypothetical protein